MYSLELKSFILTRYGLGEVEEDEEEGFAKIAGCAIFATCEFVRRAESSRRKEKRVK